MAPPAAASSSIAPDTQTIPVPSNLSASSSATLPHPTQRSLLLHLQSDPDIIPSLAATLTTSLASTGWPDRVRALALELLRSGTCTTFPELQAEVLRRAKIPPPAPASAAAGTHGNQSATSSQSTGKQGGKESVNGTDTKAGLANGATNTSSAAVILPDVRIPLKTVEEGVEFLKAKVRDVVEVVEPETLEERASSEEE